MFTNYYKKKILPQKTSSECIACLIDFISRIVDNMHHNIDSIILYGGLVRDGKSLEGWSDIDLIIVFKNILDRDPRIIANYLINLEEKYETRLDITQITVDDIYDPIYINYCYWSDILNVLSNRPNVSQVLFGELPKIKINEDQEKQAALFYLNSTIGLLRRYLIETAFRKYENEYDKVVSRLIRWTFSIVRASLRLFGIFVHPYEDSIVALEINFPNIDCAFLKTLCSIRNCFYDKNKSLHLIKEIEIYVEKYTKNMLRLYYDHEKIN